MEHLNNASLSRRTSPWLLNVSFLDDRRDAEVVEAF
jgi:hypothetical protein